MASKNGNVDCVEILIQAGANVNLCDTKNQTPFFGMCTDIELIVLRFILSLFENNINSEIVEITCFIIMHFGRKTSIYSTVKVWE